ncbi:MAG: hypothetical protein J6T57_04285 [Alphaproteobacteria bacterium]|nr:hypothetical protein [Alphaproteobacteria bacterium]
MGQVISDVTDILNYQDSKKNANETKKQILAEMASDENEKQNLVKKVLASQRAKYGAKGMSNNGITEETVLNRMKSEAEKPYENKKKINMSKLKNARATKKNLVLSALEHMDKLLG